MPRIRTIKPEFWADEKLAPLKAIDRLVFLGLIGMADDEGRVIDSVRSIDGFIFPLTEESSRKSLTTLAALGRIERGTTASGQSVIQIVNWKAHQRIDRPNTLGALPPIANPTSSSKLPRRMQSKSSGIRGTFDEDSSSRPTTNEQRPTNDYPLPTEVPDAEDEGQSGGAQRGLASFAEEWRKQHGTSLDLSRSEDEIAQVVAAVGIDEALVRWRTYLRVTDLRFTSVRAFAQKHPAFGADRHGRRQHVDRRATHLAASDEPLETEMF